jgi:hypothetical protein
MATVPCRGSLFDFGANRSPEARPVKIGRQEKRGGHGFGTELLHPGLSLGGGDSGIGAIGRIDHGRIPSHLWMHPHRDDEIPT